jgi:predicted alpha/beta superfamily hydrolase
MRSRLVLFFLLIPVVVLGQDQQTPCVPSVQGDLRLHQLTSKIFNNTRTIRVLLPAGYEAPENKDRRYPVLYMLDGQNLFDVCTGYGHQEWKIDETMKELDAQKVVPDLIIVGVDNAQERRAYEYLPYKDFVGDPNMGEPAGKQFPDFLVNEVLPYIDANYRTLRGYDNTGIGGSSYGGVAALYALMAKPNTFGYGLIESPIFWIGMGQLVRDTSPFCAAPRKIFMAFGENEIDSPVMQAKNVSLLRQVANNLQAAGYDDTNLKVVIEPGARHNEAAWARRFPAAIKFLFGDWKAPAETKN